VARSASTAAVLTKAPVAISILQGSITPSGHKMKSSYSIQEDIRRFAAWTTSQAFMSGTKKKGMNFGLKRGLIIVILSLIAAETAITAPYGSYCAQGGGWAGWNGNCGGGYYRGGCNPGGWYGTGIPNGLGWTLFGLTAAFGAGAQAYGAYVVPTPVYTAPLTTVIQQPVMVQQGTPQAPLVIYKGVPCYYLNGNYYPANPMP